MRRAKMRTVALAVTVFILLGSVECGRGFDLSPRGTKFDQDAVKSWSGFLDNLLSKLAGKGLEKFKESVHEEITHRVYECNYEGKTICGDPDAQFATPYVIAGVRWNDDPPFQLKPDQAKGLPCKTSYPDGRKITIRFVTQPECWGALFLSAEKNLKATPGKRFDQASGIVLPLRSHFGDLQFLHSMASGDGEDPAGTREKILGWAEFTWGVVVGEVPLETWLNDVPQPTLNQAFAGSGWRIQDLFALGDPSLRPQIGDVAFGSLLHAIEDSFAAGHVERLEPSAGALCPESSYRAPGPVVEFHSYGGQKSSNHAAADTREAFVNNRLAPDVVDVGRVLVSLRKHGAKWGEVKKYLLCVYNFSPAVRKASSGGF
jgi:hypothetical protein